MVDSTFTAADEGLLWKKNSFLTTSRDAEDVWRTYLDVISYRLCIYAILSVSAQTGAVLTGYTLPSTKSPAQNAKDLVTSLLRCKEV